MKKGGFGEGGLDEERETGEEGEKKREKEKGEGEERREVKKYRKRGLKQEGETGRRWWGTGGDEGKSRSEGTFRSSFYTYNKKQSSSLSPLSK